MHVHDYHLLNHREHLHSLILGSVRSHIHVLVQEIGYALSRYYVKDIYWLVFLLCKVVRLSSVALECEYSAIP